MPNLKLQYIGHLMRRTDSLEKTLMLEKTAGEEGDDRGWDGWMASLTQWTWIWASSGRWWRTGKPSMLQSIGSRSRTHCANEQQKWYKWQGCEQSWLHGQAICSVVQGPMLSRPPGLIYHSKVAIFRFLIVFFFFFNMDSAFSFFNGYTDDLTGSSYDRGIMGGYGSPEQKSKWILWKAEEVVWEYFSWGNNG